MNDELHGMGVAAYNRDENRILLQLDRAPVAELERLLETLPPREPKFATYRLRFGTFARSFIDARRAAGDLAGRPLSAERLSSDD